jgi:hypothetical protein
VKTLRQLFTGDDVIQLVIRLGLLGLLIFWTFYLIRPFVTILVWALVLAVALNPAFVLLAKLLGDRPKLAATILTRPFSRRPVSPSSSGRRLGSASVRRTESRILQLNWRSANWRFRRRPMRSRAGP